MPTVRAILDKKGQHVVTIDPSATVLDAAERMNEAGIGGLVVVDGGSIVGVFTERDILRRVVGGRRDPAATQLRDVMTTAVECCNSDTKIEACRALMTKKRIRHIPVVEEDALVGIITSGDVLAFQVGEHLQTIEHLTNYVQGRT